MGAYQREGFSMGLLYFFSSLLFITLQMCVATLELMINCETVLAVARL